ncbi:thiamine diphosphokinase [Filobacillus milosensis]|uniref:Thiamine diphosphokinase n=1 Tax=Filobacillus milosensis TaxID=94137 RepID=A0A4Y8IR37_9BACI|nr:thiamine diphosphokinase [Filobacillus milosensis]TFB23254.1 thiamine diphosphokinase [Filobacillus milosensis]
MKQVIGIVAAGPKQEIPKLDKYKDIDFWIGVDEGASTLIESNIQPDLVIGDFDSIDTEKLETIKHKAKLVKEFPNEKDETDLELAFIEAIHLKPTTVYVLGATGGRLDHAWINVHLLVKFAHTDIDAWIVNNQNQMTLKAPGQHWLEKDSSFPYISFLPFTHTVEDLTLKGFKYELENRMIKQGSTLTVSNEWSEKKGTYFFNSGILLVIKSRD